MVWHSYATFNTIINFKLWKNHWGFFLLQQSAVTSTCFYIEHFKRDQWWTNIVEESLQVTFSDLFLAPPHSSFRSFVHSIIHFFFFFQVHDMVNVQCQIQYQHVIQQLAVTQIKGVLLERGVVSSQTAPRHVSRLLCHHPLHHMVVSITISSLIRTSFF